MKRSVRMADAITGGRIILSLVLLACPLFSPAFYGVYLAAGMTDMIDGAVARRTGTESSFGAKLDTFADGVFLAAAAIKWVPQMKLPTGIWVWTGLIAATKGINVISGLVMQKRLVWLHTLANRVTGLLLFVLPLTRSAVALRWSTLVICAVATFAAVQEGHLIRTGSTE